MLTTPSVRFKTSFFLPKLFFYKQIFIYLQLIFYSEKKFWDYKVSYTKIII